MPDTSLSRPKHDQDTDGPDRRRQMEHEAGKQLACGFALYANRVRIWLDLNLETRRDALAVPPAIQKASGTGR